MSTSNVTLGLSLGTQLTGLAILKDRELVVWQVKNFEGRWTHNKLQKILKTIEQYLSDYCITRVMIKLPEPCRRSDALELLSEAIIARLKTLNIPVDVLSISDLKNRCMAQNRSELMHHVVGLYPELSFALQKATKVKKVYHFKVFEAVLTALM